MKRLFAALAATVLLAAPAHAADPVKVIVPFAAGGPVDALARILANELAPRLQTDVVVENRGGAGGVIGVEAMANSPADGLTLSLTGVISEPKRAHSPGGTGIGTSFRVTRTIRTPIKPAILCRERTA